MKLLVCGSRSITDYPLMYDTLKGIDATEIIHGGARGADTMAELYAQDRHITSTVVKPDWNAHGKAAGPIRNRQMVDMCDAVIAFWDGKSRGTKSTIDYAERIGKPLTVVEAGK